MMAKEAEIQNMADLHSHLLPGVDDGSRSAEQSVHVLAAMRDTDITDVCLTPHFTLSDLTPDRLVSKLSEHDKAYSALSAALPALPRCHRGAELMVDTRLPDSITMDRRITLAGSRYLLIEFPRDLSAEAIRALIASIRSRGIVPLVAHPERYSATTVDEVFVWRDLGAAMQVDATTFLREKGARAKRARAILEAGLADILAADNHGDDRTLASARTSLTGLEAREQAESLLRTNPQAILTDQALEPVAPIRFRRARWEVFRRFFGSGSGHLQG